MADIAKIKLPSGTTYTVKDNAAVRVAGDTMTGTLTVDEKNIQVQSPYVVGQSFTSVTYGNGYYLRDNDNTIIARLTPVFNTDGRVGSYLAVSRSVSGSNVFNSLYLYVDTDGTRSVVVSDKSSWRTGIGSPATNAGNMYRPSLFFGLASNNTLSDTSTVYPYVKLGSYNNSPSRDVSLLYIPSADNTTWKNYRLVNSDGTRNFFLWGDLYTHVYDDDTTYTIPANSTYLVNNSTYYSSVAPDNAELIGILATYIRNKDVNVTDIPKVALCGFGVNFDSATDRCPYAELYNPTSSSLQIRIHFRLLYRKLDNY